MGNKEDVITIIDMKTCKVVHEEQFKYEVRERGGEGGAMEGRGGEGGGKGGV